MNGTNAGRGGGGQLVNVEVLVVDSALKCRQWLMVVRYDDVVVARIPDKAPFLADLPLISSPFPQPVLLIIFRIDSKLSFGVRK